MDCMARQASRSRSGQQMEVGLDAAEILALPFDGGGEVLVPGAPGARQRGGEDAEAPEEVQDDRAGLEAGMSRVMPVSRQ